MNAEIAVIQVETDWFSGRGRGGNPYAEIDLNFTFSAYAPGTGGAACGSSPAMREACIRRTAIHEFGHVIGFAHEQLRPDPLLGLSTCSSQFFDGYLSDAYFVGPWDLYSIMNYCNPNRFAGSVSPLSETDKVGAQREYGQPRYFADLDGDGRADFVVVDPGQIRARFSEGAYFGTWVTMPTTGFVGAMGTHLADVDGDGKADAIAVGLNGITVRKSLGRAGFSSTVETWSTTAFLGRHGTFFADVTGDGAADVIAVSEEDVRVRRADLLNRNFGPFEIWLSKIVFPFDTGVTLNGQAWQHIPFSATIKVADVTSDFSSQGKRRADLVLFANGTTQVFRSNGTAFVAPAIVRSGTFVGSRGTFIADVNGDELGDAVVVDSLGIDDTFSGRNVGITSMLTSGAINGPLFGAQTASSVTEFFGNHGTFFANVDGLTGDEAIAVENDTILVRRQTAPGSMVYGQAQDWSIIPEASVWWWSNGTTGITQAWNITGIRRESSVNSPEIVPETTGWRLQARGDSNSDEIDDLLWWNVGTGALQVWFMNGNVRTSFANLSEVVDYNAGWRVRGVADFNQDGKSDILWHNITSGQLQVWFMNGVTRTSFGYLSEVVAESSGWRIGAVGDVNKDGRPDLLWHNGSTGALQVWLMSGLTRTAFPAINEFVYDPSGWRIAGMHDVSGRGNADIIWQHSGGSVQVWYMNGTERVGVASLPPDAPLPWRLIRP